MKKGCLEIDNKQRFEALFHRYKHEVYNFLMYYMRTTDVDDVFQETFIKVHKANDRNINQSNPKSWIIAIARNSANDYLKREGRQKKKADRLKNKSALQSTRTIEENFQLNERKKELLKAVYRMKKSYQDVVILRGIKEFSVAETAEILNWNENKVRITYHRALKKLRDNLEGGVGSESIR